MNHIIYMNASCHMYQWVTSHIDEPCDMCWNRHPLLTSHVTYINDICVTWLIYDWHIFVAHMNESCHTYEYITAYILMSHVTHRWVMCHVSKQSSTADESCDIYKWHMCDVTHPWMPHACRTHEWVMSHVWMCHVTHVTGIDWVGDGRIAVADAWRMSHVTHINLSHMWICHKTCNAHMNLS